MRNPRNPYQWILVVIAVLTLITANMLTPAATFAQDDDPCSVMARAALYLAQNNIPFTMAPNDKNGCTISYGTAPAASPTTAPTESPLALPMATPMASPTAPISPTGELYPVWEQEGGIPYNGDTSWTADLAPDEVEILTGGPASIAGVNLPGGRTRGSIVVLLPGDEVVRYTVTGLVTGSNWHGSFRPLANPTDEGTWQFLALRQANAMFAAPNCSLGTGCDTVDILIVDPNGPVSQWIEYKPASASPSATPGAAAPAATEVPAKPEAKIIPIPGRTKVEIPAGYTLRGDAWFGECSGDSWNKLLDSKSDTGMIVKFQKAGCAFIDGDWTASATDRPYNEVLAEMQAEFGSDKVQQGSW